MYASRFRNCAFAERNRIGGAHKKRGSQRPRVTLRWETHAAQEFPEARGGARVGGKRILSRRFPIQGVVGKAHAWKCTNRGSLLFDSQLGRKRFPVQIAAPRPTFTFPVTAYRLQPQRGPVSREVRSAAFDIRPRGKAAPMNQGAARCRAGRPPALYLPPLRAYRTGLPAGSGSLVPLSSWRISCGWCAQSMPFSLGCP